MRGFFVTMRPHREIIAWTGAKGLLIADNAPCAASFRLSIYTMSFPRRRVQTWPEVRRLPWIPAFAGMTTEYPRIE
jgi:hypothetical protein